MTLICKTKKLDGKSKLTAYQLEPGSTTYLTLQEMSVQSNLPVYLLRGRIYHGTWPAVAMDPPPRPPPVPAKPKPINTCKFPGCGLPTFKQYCCKSHSVKHRHMLNKEQGKIHYTGDKTQVKHRAKARKIDRATQCIHNDVECKHYSRWMSEQTGFFCKCTGYQGVEE